MASLDEIYRKLEQQRIQISEQQKLHEQQIIDNYERQRQFMMNDRKMYETIGTSSATLN